MSIIRIQNLSKKYDSEKVLEDFDLIVEESEILGVKGKTGAGKTTLFHCIAGLEDFEGSMAVKGKTSYLFQNSRLVPWLNVRKNILLPLKLEGEKVSSMHSEKMRDLASRLGVKSHLGKDIEEVSGGQKQRLLIVRALITDPDILIMDEPFNSLDEETRKETYQRVISLCREEGKTVLIASHGEDIDGFTDRVIEIGS